MSLQLNPLSPSSSWLDAQPDATSLFVQGHTYLGYLFKSLHFAHRLWRWQRDGVFAYHYFKNPSLALGDLAISQLAKDNPWLQTATLVAQVTCSAWQAEMARQAMLGTWNEFAWQLKNPKVLPFTAKAISSSWLAPSQKVVVTMRLLGALLLHSYCLSMHILDITQLIKDPTSCKGASYHLLSNIHFIFKQAQIGLKSIAMGQSHTAMPVFEYFGIQPAQLISVSKHLETLTNPSKNLLAVGWSAS